MKCLCCKYESNERSAKYCPKCGEPYLIELAIYEVDDLKTAFRAIISEEGKSIIWDNKKKFIALLKDKAPSFINLIFQIENALTNDVIRLLRSADEGKETDKASAIPKILNLLANKQGLQKSVAIDIVSYLIFGLGWNMDILKALYPFSKQETSSETHEKNNNNEQSKQSQDKEDFNNRRENDTVKRPTYSRSVEKNDKINFLFWNYQITYIIAFAFAVGAIVLLALGFIEAGAASFAASALTPVINIVMKKSFEKVVDGEVNKDSYSSKIYTDVKKLDYILSQADYFIIKKSADNETAKIFAGLIEKSQ